MWKFCKNIMNMNVIIERYFTDQYMNENKCLVHRPHVSFRISEYVWNYIYENCLKAHNIINDEYIYHITLWFVPYDENCNYKMFSSPYNRKGTYFRPLPNFRTINKRHKQICIGCFSELISEKINPLSYADLVYDMFCSQFAVLCHNINDTDLKNIKSTLDYKYINSFTFPAPFEEQKYIGDDRVMTTDDDIKVSVKEEYMRFWNNNRLDQEL